MIFWVCGILNPQYVALAGKDLRTECIGPISDTVYSFLVRSVMPEILYSADVWGDYHNGMSILTAEKILEAARSSRE